MTDSNAPQPAASGPLSADQDKLWASLAHFGGVFWLLPSLIIWLVFRERGQRTNVEGKEALNWQINFVGVEIAIIIVSTILGFIPFVGWIIALLLWLVWWVLWVLNLVFSILGGVKVQQGGSYRYPFMIKRFIA